MNKYDSRWRTEKPMMMISFPSQKHSNNKRRLIHPSKASREGDINNFGSWKHRFTQELFGELNKTVLESKFKEQKGKWKDAAVKLKDKWKGKIRPEEFEKK